MKRINGERIKLYILLILLTTSFVQVGILWNYQHRGLPTNFLSSFFSKEDKDVKFDMDHMFKPFRVVASEGYEDFHYVLDESIPEYDLLWKEAKVYLKRLLEDDNIVSRQNLPSDEWGRVVLRNAFVFEFRSNISSNLLSSFLSIREKSGADPKQVFKFAILPAEAEEINNNIVIYVYDGLKTTRYVLPYNKSGLGKETYNSILEKIESDSNNKGFRVMKEFSGAGKKLLNIKSDVLIDPGSKNFKDYKTILSSIPKELKSISFDKTSDIDKVAQYIVGKDKDNYIKYVDAQEAIAFYTSSDIYKVYRDGLLEYRYLSGSEKSDKGSESEAFKKALEFMEIGKSLISGGEVYLSGSTEDEDSYTFYFDYKVNQVPVAFINYPIKNKDLKALNNAIIIKVNSKRVLSCHWIMKEFEIESNKHRMGLYFEDIIEDTFTKYEKVKNSNYAIRDINVFYEANYNIYSESLLPVWVVETEENKFYIVPMRKKDE